MTPSTTGPKLTVQPWASSARPTGSPASAQLRKNELAPPFDFAVRAHPSDLVVDRIVGLAQNAVPAPGRGLIMFGGGGVAERLVRALLIIETLKGAEAVELLAQAVGRRRGGVLEQSEMHALVSSVLLWLAGRYPLRHDPGLDHQNRKPRQPAKADGGERRAVVGAQSERQAELAEGGVEHRPDMFAVALGQRLTAQEIAAHRVGEGQRLATGPVAGQEPALEVDAPHVIGRPAMREGRGARAGSFGAACASPSAPRDRT